MENLGLSIANGEVISKGSVIELRPSRPVTLQAGQTAVKVLLEGNDTKVTVNVKGTYVIQGDPPLLV